VDPAAEAAIRTGNNVLATDYRGIAQDTVGDELRMLDKIGGMADDAWHQHFACRPQLDFEVPIVPGRRWYRFLDTARPSPEDIVEAARQLPIEGDRVRVEGRSVLVLLSQ